MGWFSNLFTNEAVSFALVESSERSIEPYSAVRAQIASGRVIEQISILRNLLLKLPVSNPTRNKILRSGNSVRNYGVSQQWPHREKLNDLLSLLARSTTDIDVERSDMKTLFHINDLCNTKLPAMLRELELRIGQKDWSDEPESLRAMEQAVSEVLGEIAKLPTKRSILNIEVLDNNPTAKDFVDIEYYKDNPEVFTLLEALKADWDKASLLPLSAEDDYVIERVANSYLPDALLLFDRFCHRTGSTNTAKALEIVKEQIKLIHQQVSFVLEQHEEDSFSLMETHTEFLKAKNARIGVPDGGSKIQLSKGSSENAI